MLQTSKIVLAIIITAVVVGSGVYFWQAQVQEQQNSESVIGQDTKLETFSLNQDGGFSFQHPTDWKTESSSSPEIGSTKITVSSPDWSHLEKGAEFLVWINPPGSGYEYLVKDLGSSDVYLGSVLATKNLSSDESGKINAAILQFNKESNFYFIKYEFVAKTDDEKNRYFAILDNIINTFKLND